jgi:hypothetical protein
MYIILDGKKEPFIENSVGNFGRGLKMENRNEYLSNEQKVVIGAGGLSKKITTPCSEKEILYLQNIFTTPGFHALTVPSVAVGRELITQQLGALQWHQDIGYLTADQTAVCAGAQNLGSLIDQPIDQESLETFFIQRFYCDFLWIEATDSLLAMPWIYAFEKQLINYHVEKMIPIVILTYHS